VGFWQVSLASLDVDTPTAFLVGDRGMESNHRLVLFEHALYRLSYPSQQHGTIVWQPSRDLAALRLPLAGAGQLALM
jgi:hypothetical protein